MTARFPFSLLTLPLCWILDVLDLCPSFGELVVDGEFNSSGLDTKV